MPKKAQTLGEYSKSLWMRIPQIIKFTFIMTFLTFLIIHLYCFTNKFMNHDDAIFSDGGAGITSGRWFKNWICTFSSTYSMPWITGILSALYMALAVCCVVGLFQIQHKLSACLIAVIMSSNPVIAATFSYMYTADAYIMALTLACFGAFVTQKYKHGWIIGAISFACSLGIYQAYFGMAVALIVFSLLYNITNEELNTKALILKCLRSLLSLLFGLVLYKIILEYLLKIQNLSLSTYMGISSMWDVTPGILLERVKTAYRNFAQFYNLKKFELYPVRTQKLYRLTILGLYFALFCQIILKKAYRKPLLLLTEILLALLLPLSCMIIFVMSTDVHMLMVYPVILPFIAAVVLLDKIFCRIPLNVKGLISAALCGVMAFCVCFHCYDSVVITNKAYFKMDVIYKQTYAYSVKLTERIESTDGYVVNMPTAFIGRVNPENHPSYTSNTFIELNRMTGVETEWSALLDPTIREFCEYYLGVTLPGVSSDKLNSLHNSEIVQQMPNYPAEGSIALIDEIMVVKFSD